LHHAQDIARQRLLKRLFVGRFERRVISRLPAIKRFAEFAHLARHREIANAHFPQVIVEVTAEQIEQLLPDPPEIRCRGRLRARLRLAAEPAQNQHKVQDDQLKTAVDAVGDPIAAIERHGARLRHDGAIEALDIVGVAAAPKYAQDHRDSSRP